MGSTDTRLSKSPLCSHHRSDCGPPVQQRPKSSCPNHHDPLIPAASGYSLDFGQRLRKLALAHFLAAVLSVVVQVIVTSMATLYRGLYAWTDDGPFVARSSTGIFAGLAALVSGIIQYRTAAQLLRPRATPLRQLGSHVCAIKLMSCVSLLTGLLLFCSSIYLTWVLSQWWSLSGNPQYAGYLAGPASAALTFNLAQITLALIQITLAFVVLLLKDTQ